MDAAEQPPADTDDTATAGSEVPAAHVHVGDSPQTASLQTPASIVGSDTLQHRRAADAHTAIRALLLAESAESVIESLNSSSAPSALFVAATAIKADDETVRRIINLFQSEDAHTGRPPLGQAHVAMAKRLWLSPPWRADGSPLFRRPVPHDFSPGGVLCDYCALDDREDVSAQEYAARLLRPLLIHPKDLWAIVRPWLLKSDAGHMSKQPSLYVGSMR
ncbi:hypothetical protein psal_cds_556 [Pandoravirus salinus]|uniref:Uncharacterized protein n=1 Tax=Pandoravirus salinus TaxID=1349410 RepID=S4VY62_9VIRU|nr:hypothetical protein psal_cds_556 [Pandoravirus salinus]AGO84401.1 hypothetical protein psal_cds_556 [Pandoravirus salinus]